MMGTSETPQEQKSRNVPIEEGNAGAGNAGDTTLAPVSFAQLLLHLRVAAGYTQEELAEQAQVSVRSISDFERGGRHIPRLQTIYLLASALNLPPAERDALIAAAEQHRDALRQKPAAPPKMSSSPVVPAPTVVGEHTSETPSVLPAPITPLIGRDAEVHATGALVLRSDVRLVTLTGEGGVGKTRVALATASQLESSFTDGVLFISLASITDSALVLTAVAHQLGIADAKDEPQQASLLHTHLRNKHLLLVMDNFEHLIAAAPAISSLLSNCQHVKVLVTSRSRLHISGEHEYPIRPLSFPHPDHLPAFEVLASSPAITLFVQRAQACDPVFALTPANASFVAAICAYLDGLPLAIELAAARIKLFAPASLLSYLQRQPLKILSGGPQDLPDRQQTLRATLDWSYGLLRQQEQHIFRRLAVFRGGCTIDAAEAVSAASLDSNASATIDDTNQNALDALFALFDHHLLVRQTATWMENLPGGNESDVEGPRIMLLETVREYARERLELAGDAAAAEYAHARLFLAFAEAAEPSLRGPDQHRWLTWLERDHANLNAALLWWLGRREAESSLRMAGALGRYWWIRGYLAEGHNLLERAIGLADATGDALETPAYAKALHNAGLITQRLGDHAQAIAYYEAALSRYRMLKDERGAAGALNNLGTIARERGDLATASAYYSDCLAACRALGDEWGCAIALTNLGTLAHDRGNYADAATWYEESLAIRRRLNDTRGISVALAHLAALACAQGEATQAQTWCEECLALRRVLGDRWGIAEALDILANSMRLQHDLSQAERMARESVALGRELADMEVLAFSLTTLAHIKREQREWAEACAIYDEALCAQLQIGNTLGNAMCLEGVSVLASQLSTITEPLQNAHHMAELSTYVLGAATAMRTISGMQRYPIEQSICDAAITQLQMTLGKTQFASAWLHGEGLMRERATEYAQHILAMASGTDKHSVGRIRMEESGKLTSEIHAEPKSLITRAHPFNT